MRLKAVTGIVLTVLLLGMLTLAFNIARAQPPATEWTRTYGGADYDWGWSVVETSDDGYALAGITYSFGADGPDFWLVKVDSSGNQQWNKTHGGASDDGAYSVAQTSDGGYALAGYTNSFGAGYYDFWLVKVDSSGNMQWNKTYGGNYTDWGWSVVETSDDGYALAGVTASFGVGGDDFWLVKVDPSGNVEWNKTYGGANTDGAWSVVEASDGGYALAGVTKSFGAGGYDSWLVKTDATGNVEWNKTYGGASSDITRSVVETSDGYALAGYTKSFGAGGYDFWLVKVDSSGNMQWNKTHGGAGSDIARSVVETGDGGYALAGLTYSFGAGSADFWLVKVDSSGNMEWNKTFGGASDEGAYSVVETSDGGYALAGDTNSFGAGGDDFWLVKVAGATPPPYDVTIKAYCYAEGTPVSVSITMDGSPTGYNTPHTFTGLTGTHTFTVPSNDSNGHPFKQWNTGEISTTITLTSGGTYTAYYETPPLPVGGIWVPVDKFGLLAPYIGLTLTIILATVATGVFVKYKKKQ